MADSVQQYSKCSTIVSRVYHSSTILHTILYYYHHHLYHHHLYHHHYHYHNYTCTVLYYTHCRVRVTSSSALQQYSVVCYAWYMVCSRYRLQCCSTYSIQYHSIQISVCVCVCAYMYVLQCTPQGSGYLNSTQAMWDQVHHQTYCSTVLYLLYIMLLPQLVVTLHLLPQAPRRFCSSTPPGTPSRCGIYYTQLHIMLCLAMLCHTLAYVVYYVLGYPLFQLCITYHKSLFIIILWVCYYITYTIMHYIPYVHYCTIRVII